MSFLHLFQSSVKVVILGATLAVLMGQPMAASDMTPDQEVAMTKSFELSMTARDLFNQGRYLEADPLLREVLEIAYSFFPDSPLTIASALHNVAASTGQLGRLAEAELLTREALQLRQENGGIPDVILSSQQLLASILNDLGQYEEAGLLQQALVERSLAGDGVGQANLVRNFATLAYLKAVGGNLPEAFSLINQLAPMIPDMAPEDVPLVLNTLGRISSLSGKPDDAENYYLAAVQRSAGLEFGENWTVKDAATIYGNFAAMLSKRGRVFEALPLFEHADQLLIEAGLVETDGRATILDGKGEAFRAQKLYAMAYEAQRTALDIRQKTLPESHRGLGISFSNIGLTLLQTGEFELAAQALTKSVAIQRANKDPIRVANAAINLSGALAALGDHAAAHLSASEAAESLRSVLPEGHPRLVTAAFNQAWLHLGAEEPQAARAVSADAMDHYIANSWRLDSDGGDGTGQLRDSRRQVLATLVSLWDVEGAAGMDRAFEVAQWAQASEAGHVSRRVAARFAAGESEIADLARQKQDLTNLWRVAEQRYLAKLGRDADTQVLEQDMTNLETQIKTLNNDLAARFPEYSNLTRPSVVSITDLQKLLGRDEALLLPITTPDETYVFAITQRKSIWVRSNLTARDLDAAVRSLRAGLDPNAPSRSAEALSDEPEGTEGPDYDVETAHTLYQSIFAGVAEVLNGKQTVYVVKEGALTGLPLSVLLTTPFDADTVGADLSQADWLLHDHAFVTLPSVSSFVGQRVSVNRRQAEIAFAGFGDPDFKGTPEQEIPSTLASLYTRGAANPAQVQKLAALPGTRREIEGLATLLSASQGAVYLGPNATETAVKSSDYLRKARVVVFATHGLVAGELSGLTEPALAFSAPSQASATDDGLLTASEAAELDLAADWVILSACNTAAPDGTPGGEGLSGLASSFLYAGARSLLVSHWPVRDDAAELITTGALKAQANNPEFGNAEALRLSMIDLIENSGIADAPHPSTWAPFTVVGANGASSD